MLIYLERLHINFYFQVVGFGVGIICTYYYDEEVESEAMENLMDYFVSDNISLNISLKMKAIDDLIGIVHELCSIPSHN